MTNEQILHRFITGWRFDKENHSEENSSYTKGINGRMFMDNGVLSYSSIYGTKKVLEIQCLKKILGYSAFNQELIIFGKANKNCVDNIQGLNEIKRFSKLEAESFSTTPESFKNFNEYIKNNDYYGTSKKIELKNLIARDINLDISTDQNEVLFSPPTNYNRIIIEDESDTADFNSNFYCSRDVDQEIDFSYLFETNLNVPHFGSCSIDNNRVQNQNDYDIIYKVTKDESGFNSKIIWKGYLGWRYNDKISTENIYENEFNKRVYFTNYRGELKSINLKDKKLSTRHGQELNNFQNNILLNPKIVSKEVGGNVKAGVVFFSYRLVTENGQVSDFSSLSERVVVLKESDFGYTMQGGNQRGDVSDKKINVQCIIKNHSLYKEVEMFAIHFISPGSPLVIPLGIKNTNQIVEFTYYGNESDIESNVVLADIINRSANWKYCSDIKSVQNTLYASGLRNEPVTSVFNKLKLDFALKSWSMSGSTYNCAINPKPWEFRVIPKIIPTQKLYSIKQRYYSSIRVFDSFNISIVNNLTGASESLHIESLRNSYIDYTTNIFEWLKTLDLSLFDNLKIEEKNGGILFSRINESIETDLSNYQLKIDNNQSVIDYEESIDYNNASINIGSNNWEYGAISLGYNQGNGIKITYKEIEESVLKKNTDVYENNKPILKIEIPSEKRGFHKNEIYRIGIEFQLTNGDDLFVIPLGDLKIPGYGDVRPGGGDYSNTRISGDDLMARKIIIEASVQLDCDVQKEIKSYRLVYVERLEYNRTILCQGISGPLERVLPFDYDYYYTPNEKITNKWMLPFLGGPTYDVYGLNMYDTDSEIGDPDSSSHVQNPLQRVVTHRSLFYFDSPDVNFGIISSSKIKNGKLRVISKLNTDHLKGAINIGYKDHNPGGGSWNVHHDPNEMFPSFSNVIQYGNFQGEDEQLPLLVNVSVFANEEPKNLDKMKIDFSRLMTVGEVIPGIDFDTDFDISNNSISLEYPYWYHSIANRAGLTKFFGSRNLVTGNRTVIIKSKEDLFTDEFIGETFPLHSYVQRELRDNVSVPAADSYALINIEMGNEESVYGGRSELAYSKNIFIPLSETIPVTGSTAEQVFDVYGDTYTTLYVRTKSDWSNAENMEGSIELDGGRGKYDEHVWRKFGAWCYAFVVESTVEPKYTYESRFYQDKKFDFGTTEEENINMAYLQERNLKSSVPARFRFKDDPEMLNLIASSETKSSGDFYDAWSIFRVNNFYELEKKKGVAFNLVGYLNNLFVIQEEQTSNLIIDPNAFVQTDQGQVALKQGNGGNITNHKPISDYGTTIRNSVKSIDDSDESAKGFFFFDEKRNEFIRIDKALFYENELSIEMKNRLENDPVIDAIPFYDDKYKELNICIRTKSNKSYVISYSSTFNAFNGIYEMKSHIFINWNQIILSPDDESTLTKLDIHQLNEGNVLSFFNSEKKLKLGFICNKSYQVVKIYKHISGNISLNTHVDKIFIKTSSGQEREIYGTHHRYKIREGLHSVPLKNRTDWSDLRGEYAYFELEISPVDPSKLIKIHDLIIYIRNSYQ